MLGVQTCALPDRKSTRLNSSHTIISYAVFCLKKHTVRNIPSPDPTHIPLLAPALLVSAIRADAPSRALQPHHAALFFFLIDRASPDFSPLPLPAPLPI